MIKRRKTINWKSNYKYQESFISNLFKYFKTSIFEYFSCLRSRMKKNCISCNHWNYYLINDNVVFKCDKGKRKDKGKRRT
jgi:hypothetical protein